MPTAGAHATATCDLPVAMTTFGVHEAAAGVQTVAVHDVTGTHRSACVLDYTRYLLSVFRTVPVTPGDFWLPGDQSRV
jgi:hypothetical protein